MKTRLVVLAFVSCFSVCVFAKDVGFPQENPQLVLTLPEGWQGDYAVAGDAEVLQIAPPGDPFTDEGLLMGLRALEGSKSDGEKAVAAVKQQVEQMYGDAAQFDPIEQGGSQDLGFTVLNASGEMPAENGAMQFVCNNVIISFPKSENLVLAQVLTTKKGAAVHGKKLAALLGSIRPAGDFSAEESTASTGADDQAAESENDGMEDGISPAQLVGLHRWVDDSLGDEKIEGIVNIEADKDGVLTLEWHIGSRGRNSGTGILVGNILGVLKADGLAIYQVVGQAAGISLVGIWKREEEDWVGRETILIGEPDIETMAFEIVPMNGSYRTVRLVSDGEITGTASIRGGDFVKSVKWQISEMVSESAGLALGDGIVITSDFGFTVLNVQSGDQSSLAGVSLAPEIGIFPEVFTRED